MLAASWTTATVIQPNNNTLHAKIWTTVLEFFMVICKKREKKSTNCFGAFALLISILDMEHAKGGITVGEN